MPDLQKWLTNELRRIHAKWAPRNQAYREARVARGKYKCAHCGEIFRPKEIDIDHIDPVINPDTSFVDWNDYVARLFQPKEGYQILCKPCHSVKSAAENKLR